MTHYFNWTRCQKLEFTSNNITIIIIIIFIAIPVNPRQSKTLSCLWSYFHHLPSHDQMVLMIYFVKNINIANTIVNTCSISSAESPARQFSISFREGPCRKAELRDGGANSLGEAELKSSCMGILLLLVSGWELEDLEDFFILNDNGPAQLSWVLNFTIQII